MSDFVTPIKIAAAQYINTMQLTDIVIGVVESIKPNPLTIKVTDKLILNEKQIVLCKSVKELNIKDKVVMIRKTGGQQFFVIDLLGDD